MAKKYLISLYDMSEKEFVGFLLSMEGKEIKDSLIVVTLQARWSSNFEKNDRKFVLNDREVFYTSDFFNEIKPLLNTYVEETNKDEEKNPF